MTSKENRFRILVCKPRPSPQIIRMERMVCSEPLELEYIYTALHKTDDVFLLDGCTDHRNPVRLAEKIHADIVLFTAYITNIGTVLETAAQLKKMPKPPKIFVGGAHAEVIPEHFASKNIDGVLYANQLVGIVNIVDRLRQNIPYDDIPSALIKSQGGYCRNPPASSYVDTLPIPSRPLLRRQKHRYKYMYYKPCASIKTSFGCPQKCSFCFCQKMNGGAFTTRPIQDVIDEIEGIDVHNILIVDDNFLTSKKRLLDFCQEIEKRKIKKEFIVYGTARFVAQNPDVMKELRRAGLTGLMVGLEFVTDEELLAFHKNSTIIDNNRTIDICKRLDIELFALFIINPDWRHKNFQMMAHYLRKHELTFAAFSTMTVFPGTDLAQQQRPLAGHTHRWWRYDLLRLHQPPAHMSYVSYYFWLFYLYMLPGLHLDNLRRIQLRYGSWGAFNLILKSWLIALEFFFKLTLWK